MSTVHDWAVSLDRFPAAWPDCSCTQTSHWRKLIIAVHHTRMTSFVQWYKQRWLHAVHNNRIPQFRELTCMGMNERKRSFSRAPSVMNKMI